MHPSACNNGTFALAYILQCATSSVIVELEAISTYLMGTIKTIHVL